MSRYSVDIKANLIGFDKLDAIEKQIQKLKSQTVDVKFNMTGFNGSGSANYNKQFEVAGKRASTSFATGMKSVKFNGFYKDYFKQLEADQKKAEKLSGKYNVSNTNALKAIKAKRAAEIKANQEYAKELSNREKLEKSTEDRWLKNLYNREQAQTKLKQKERAQREKLEKQVEERWQKNLFEKERLQLSKQQAKQQNELEQKRNLLSKYSKNFDTGDYSAGYKEMSSKLSKYDRQNSESLNRAKAHLDEYNSIYKDIQNHFSKKSSIKFTDDELINKFDSLESAARKYRNTMREVAAESTKSVSVQTAITKSNEILNYYNKNTKAAKKYGETLQTLARQAKEATTQEDFNKVNNQFKVLKSQISEEGLTGRSYATELKRGFAQIGQFVGVYGILQKGVDTAKMMARAVLDVDTAMTELRKVSNVNDLQLSNYFDSAVISAKKYGAAIDDVILSTADWSRLGYGLKDASMLSNATTMLQRVGDNMTQESSSQGLISILKGFGKEASDVNLIVDKINEVANTEPIDTAGIVSGLQRSASSLSAAGNTIDESISMITAAKHYWLNMWKHIYRIYLIAGNALIG